MSTTDTSELSFKYGLAVGTLKAILEYAKVNGATSVFQMANSALAALKERAGD